MSDNSKIFKYSKETLEEKINNEQEIKLNKRSNQYKDIFISIPFQFKIRDNIELLSVKCFINKDSMLLKYIVIYFDKHTRPDIGETTRQIKIYNNKFYVDGKQKQLTDYLYWKYDGKRYADYQQTYFVIKEAQKMFEDIRKQIFDIFDIQTYAQKQAKRLKKRII